MTAYPPDDQHLGQYLNQLVGQPTQKEAVVAAGQIYDLGLAWPYDANMYTTQTIRRAMAGLGFHGHLVHGCHLAVCNAGASAQLDAMLAAGSYGTRWKPMDNSATWPNAWGDAVYWNQQRPEGFVLLRPGETIRFARPLREGIYCALCTTEEQQERGSGATVGQLSRKPDPLVRIYPPDAHVPEGLGYIKTPYENRHEVIETDDPTATTLDYDQAVWLPDGTTHIVVTFWDDTAWTGYNKYSPISAGESGSYEVWFGVPTTPVNQWLHHHDDDFDAAGRGVVSPSHATEIYEVAEMAQTVYIRQTAGDDFFYSIFATQVGRR